MKKNILILMITNLIIIILSTKTNIFGSTLDYLNQHIVFPEYLRETFYQTGKIIPSLVNLGAGQNVYNIAYYGLLNPIILLSYFFPFIKMIDYIIISNIILLVFTNVLFYNFIKTKFDEKITLTISLLFTLSGPLIFQFHRHFMFVNYMPFLILSLINIDKDKKINLIIDIFLIIMTSFYYSIPSIIVILIYYIYKNFKNFKLKEFLKVLMCIIVAILLSSILLLPTLNAILETRSSNITPNIFDLMIPNINLDNILYGAYAPGLTSIAFISLLYLLFTRRKENVFLTISIQVICFVPIFLYLLNGGLYIRSKALIPFLPLLVYVIGLFLNDLFKEKIDIKKFLIFLLIANLIVLINYHVLIFYLDLIFMVLLIIIYSKTKKAKIITIPLIILNIIICLLLNKTETFISKDYYKEVSKIEPTTTEYVRTTSLNNIDSTMNRTYNNYIPTIYSSTINKYYYNLYHNTFKVNNPFINDLMLGSTSNVLFNEYLGVKYIISDEVLGYPYEYLENNLYKLEQALPLAYVNNKTVNKEYYETLPYPYNLDILLNYVIDGDSTYKPKSNIKKIVLEYTYELGDNIEVIKNDGITLNVKKDDIITINLKDNLEEKLLFINIYGLAEYDNDIKMTINAQENLLTNKNWLYPNNNNTFYYCLNGVLDKLEIKLTKGIYNITNVEMFILDNKEIENIKDDLDEFNITIMNNELISGNISVQKDGYFVVSIPYDKGFEIKVNDKKVDYQIINNSFIGLYLEKGDYKIDISYTPPLLKEGIVLSLIGLVIFIIICIKKYPRKLIR